MKKLSLVVAFILLYIGVYAQSFVPPGEPTVDNVTQALFGVVFTDMTDLMHDRHDYSSVVELGKEFTGWTETLPARITQSVPFLWYSYLLTCEAAARNGQLEEAVGYLKKGIDKGCNHYRYLLDLEIISDLAGYAPYNEIVAPMREEAGFIDILRRANGYTPGSSSDNQKGFTYAGPDDEELASVREYFGLEAIAGDGDEISRIVNLLDWVKSSVPHNGAKQYMGEPNALDIYKYSKETGNGVNCRMLATILNECYLSLGYPSRIITCLPESGNDLDCHVINSVWSEELGKWLWMDPTYAAYVTDGADNLLSIGEVRQRLIDGLPVHVRKGANWNGLNELTDEYYLHQYMAKNLYCIETVNAFGFNTELDMVGETVLLKPHDTNYWRKVNIPTSDPEYFWQPPAGR